MKSLKDITDEDLVAGLLQDAAEKALKLKREIIEIKKKADAYDGGYDMGYGRLGIEFEAYEKHAELYNLLAGFDKEERLMYSESLGYETFDNVDKKVQRLLQMPISVSDKKLLEASLKQYCIEQKKELERTGGDIPAMFRILWNHMYDLFGKGVSDFKLVEDFFMSMLSLKKKNKVEFGESVISALKQNVKTKWGKVKVMLVGQGGAGKTSTVRSLLGKDFIETHESTCGVDTTDVSVTQHHSDQEFREDKTGLEKVLSQQANKACGRIRRGSFRKLDIQETKNDQGESENKKEKEEEEEEEEIEMEKQKEKAKTTEEEIDIDVQEAAKCFDGTLKAKYADTDKQIEELSFTFWDYGGQEVFYALHHLFLTENGLYLVVFDLRRLIYENLEEWKLKLDLQLKDKIDPTSNTDLKRDIDSKIPCLKTLQFWLDSIALHAPQAKIILVATHADILEKLEKAETKKLQRIIDNVLTETLQLEQTTIVRNKFIHFFPVDNKNRSDVDILRECIINQAQNEDYVKKELPLRWMYVFDKLIKDSEKSYFSLNQVEEIANQFHVDDTMEMLKFFHDLGVLIHLTKPNSLKEIVITKPQWLLDKLTRIICDPRHMDIHIDRIEERIESEGEFDNSEILKGKDQWENEGIITRPFLNWLWNDEPKSSREYLIVLMKTMLLCVEQEDVYIVPSLLGSKELEKREQNPTICWFEVKFMPKGIFQRFTCLLVNAFNNVSFFENGTGCKVLEMNGNTSEIRVPPLLCQLQVQEKRFILYFEEVQNNTLKQEQVCLIIKGLWNLFKNIDDEFMKTKLDPKLVLYMGNNNAGYECDDYNKAVYYRSLIDVKEKGLVESLGGKYIESELFQMFLNPQYCLDNGEKSDLEKKMDKMLCELENTKETVLHNLENVKQSLESLTYNIESQLSQHAERIQKTILSESNSRVPPLWTLQCVKKQVAAKNIYELKLLSQYSGETFHKPIELKFPNEFIQRNMKHIKMGLRVLQIGLKVAANVNLPIDFTQLIDSEELENVCETFDVTTNLNEILSNFESNNIEAQESQIKNKSSTSLETVLHAGGNTEFVKNGQLKIEALVQYSNLQRVVNEESGLCIWVGMDEVANATGKGFGCQPETQAIKSEKIESKCDNLCDESNETTTTTTTVCNIM